MKCNLIQEIKVITDVTYTDIDDCTDIAYFKDLEDGIPFFNDKISKRVANFRDLCRREVQRSIAFDIQDEDPFSPMGHPYAFDNYLRNREIDLELIVSYKESEYIEEECKDVKINEMHAYDRNSRHTRALLQSIQLN